MSAESWRTAATLLEAAGHPLSQAALERIQDHLAWIQSWNPVAGFVSRRDESRLEPHALDSLGLVPYANRASVWLDIGSGGGFPAIPCAIVLPDVHVVVVERSEKKAGLLMGLIGSLDLGNVEVVLGSFPGVSVPDPDVVTARAVEQPRRIHPCIAKVLRSESRFLCQSEPTWWQRHEMFHVEQVHDAWTDAGLRRGELYRITLR